MSTKDKSKNLVNEILETQANAVDQLVENTKKITQNIPIVQETIDKGHAVLKESLKKQKEWASSVTEKIETTTKDMNENSNEMQKFFYNWFENQMNWAKNMSSNNPLNAMNGQSSQNWLGTWNNFMNQQNSMFNQMNNSWSSMFNNPMLKNNSFNLFNPLHGMSANSVNQKINDNLNDWATQMKEFSKMMSNAYEEWAKQFHTATTSDAFKGMTSLQDHMSKFFELWVPMFKSMSDKTFNSKIFSDNLNMDKYKEFMDSFFKFMPDENQKMMQQMNHQFIEFIKNIAENSGNSINSFSKQLFNLDSSNSNNPYSNIWEMYSNWKNAMNEAVSPLTKLVENNQYYNNAIDWSGLSDMMASFQLKNSELQYMIYQNGIKVMNKLSEKISEKIKSGNSIDSIVGLYHDWMMLGDETFTELFNSDTYSKLMTEVSSLQMKIKNQMDQIMEKTYFINLPLATRTEMDEVYKNIYDLRKMYHHLERYINNNNVDSNNTESKKNSK